MTDEPIQVLLVEDAPTDALIVREELTPGKSATFTVTHVERLAEAFQQLKDRDFGVVLLDLSLPDSDGFETFVRLRKAAADVPIIVLSGRTDENLAIKAVQAGAQDYLVKGHLDEQVLPRAIRYAIERKRSEEVLRTQSQALERINNELTDRNEALLRSEKSLRLFRALIDQSIDAVTVMDPETGRFLDVNETTCQRLGYSREEMLSMSLPDIEATAVTSANLQEHLEEVRSAGFKVLEGRHRRKNGSSFPVEVSVQFIHLDQGYLVAVVRDITERKRADDVLRASENRYRSLITATAQIVWTVEPNGQVSGALPEWQKFTGQSIEEVQGNGWAAAVHSEDAEHAVKTWSASVQSKGTFETEFRLRRFDGIYRNVTSRGVPVFAENGTVCEWVGCCVDITERKEAEKKINDQLYELQRWRRAMLGREDRVQTLKSEVNEVLRQAGKPPHYASPKTAHTNGI